MTTWISHMRKPRHNIRETHFRFKSTSILHRFIIGSNPAHTACSIVDRHAHTHTHGQALCMQRQFKMRLIHFVAMRSLLGKHSSRTDMSVLQYQFSLYNLHSTCGDMQASENKHTRAHTQAPNSKIDQNV